MDAPVLAMRPVFEQTGRLQPVRNTRNRGAVDQQPSAQLGPALAIPLPKHLEEGVLRRRHAVGSQLSPRTPGNLLAGLADQEGDAVLDAVHAILVPARTSRHRAVC